MRQIMRRESLEIEGEQIIYSQTNYYKVGKWKRSYAQDVKLGRTEGSNYKVS